MSELRIPPPCHDFLRAEFLEIGQGRSVVRFVPTDEMTNPFGQVQGGILAGMIDNCAGPALFSKVPGRQASMIQLSVNYLGPVKPGERIIGRAAVVKAGRTQAVTEASLERESDGEVLVRAVATSVFLGEVPAVDLTRILRR